MSIAERQDNSALRGFAFTFAAFGLWGILPLWVKTIDHVPVIDFVAYRILFSVPVAGCILLVLGRTADLKAAFGQPRTLMMALLTGSLIAVNWGIYTWAILVDRAVETALGYYINPLVNVLLGALFLRERFTGWQLIAIGLAVAAVAILTVQAGGLPWISLALAFTFGIYGFLRKTLPIGPSQGFFLEVLLLSLPAFFLLIWVSSDGGKVLFDRSPSETVLLLLAGPVTTIPLICFAVGARLLRYSTVGLMQYIAPSLIFLIAIFVFEEPFSGWQFLAFCLIWTGLAIYSWSTLRSSRANS